MSVIKSSILTGAQYYVVNSAEKLHFNSAFSFEFYGKINDFNTIGIFGKERRASEREYFCRTDSNNKLAFILADGGSITMGRETTGLSARNGDMVYIRGTWTGGTTPDSIKLYIDNTRADVANITAGTFTGITTSGCPFYIGRYESSSVNFKGEYSMLRFWNVNLDEFPDLVDDLWNNGEPHKAAIPYGFWDKYLVADFNFTKTTATSAKNNISGTAVGNIEITGQQNLSAPLDSYQNTEINIPYTDADPSKECFVVFTAGTATAFTKSSQVSNGKRDIKVVEGSKYVVKIKAAELQEVEDNNLRYNLYVIENGEPVLKRFGNVTISEPDIPEPEVIINRRHFYNSSVTPESANYKQGDIVKQKGADTVLIKGSGKSNLMHFENVLNSETVNLTKAGKRVIISGAAGNAAVNLPPAQEWKNQFIEVIKNDPSYEVTVVPTGSETINGVNSAITLSNQYSSCLLMSTGSELISIYNGS